MKAEIKEGINIPMTKDVLQIGSPLEVPEIRVWCHPHKVGRTGSDSYFVFKTFKEALEFCAQSDEAEEIPLIAFRGYEINLFEIK